MATSATGALGGAELTVDVDVYSDEEVPRALTDRPAAVVAEPRSYVDETSVDNFCGLMSMADLGQFVRELYAQIAPVDLTVATYTGPRGLSAATSPTMPTRSSRTGG